MIRWGIIGAGRIAKRFAAALQSQPDSTLYAISCRTQEKADAFAKAYGNPKAYAGFEHIVNDPDVDAVYIATPHAHHLEWILACLKEGKPVLCEKPLCLNASEVQRVIEVQKETGVLCMEALKTRFVPLYEKIREIVTEGVIGEVTCIKTCLCSLADLSRKDLYYTNPNGGGALLDEGIYNAGWIEQYGGTGWKLQDLKAVCRDGIDVYTEAHLCNAHCTAVLECAFDRKKEKTAVITGTKGRIVIPDFHRPVKAEVQSVNETGYTIEAPYIVDDMYGQIDHFVKLMQEGKQESDVVPLSVSLHCAQLLDTIAAGTVMDAQAVSLLETQEELLQYDAFDSQDALKLAQQIIALQKNYDRNIALSIFDEKTGLEVIRIMQAGTGERNLGFMHGKRNSALACGHSSLYAGVRDLAEKKERKFDENHCPTGGAFPIRVKGEWTHTIVVSGLHEGRDHEIIVRALCAMLKKQVDDYPYMLV
ncbi:MAG: Gfo/Idh/MocA family oxidoreductase [Bulleidia sp.]